MKRLLIGVIAVAVLAVGGWFGFNMYVQRRATAEVEAAFAQIRASGGKASHGRIAFDLPTRTLAVEDIAVDPGQLAQMHIKIAGIKAAGLRQADEARFSADTIEFSGIEFAIDSQVGPSPVKAFYKIPQATIRDYAGAISIQSLPASNAIADLYRFGIEQFSNVAASSILVPTIAVAITGKPDSGAPENGEITYSGLAIKNLNHGKIEATKADRFTFTLDVRQFGKSEKVSGELSNLVMNEFDATAMLASLDPQKANDDTYHRVYGQIAAGPYSLNSTLGVSAQIDSIAFEDIGVQPSKFRLAELLAALPADQSAPPTPAQAREMMEKLAGVYEGMRVGKIALGNLSMTTPQGTASLNAVKYDRGEFALEGLDAPLPQGQFKMERFALKAVSPTNLMRWAALYSDPLRRPSPDKALGLFGVVAGVEVKGISAPYKTTNKLVAIDRLSLDWGQLVGSIPTKASLNAKMVAPTDPTNPALMPLIAAGLDQVAIDLNVGAAWTESSSAFALEPLTVDIGNLGRAQARVSLAHVPRGVFSVDQAEVLSQAAQIEAGSLELSLRDNGAVDLVVAQVARIQNIGRDAARQSLIESVRTQRGEATAANPDAGAAVDALARFIETPGQTLVVKLTPLGKVPGTQLIQLLKSEPLLALKLFRIEASTGL
jgi:hypothetical protein